MKNKKKVFRNVPIFYYDYKENMQLLWLKYDRNILYLSKNKNIGPYTT